MEISVENKILDAAFKVINEHTISGTRMHLISAECGMAQSNLHYHFKTKRELLIAVATHMQDFYNETRQAALSQGEQSRRGQLGGFFAQKKQLIMNHPEYDRVQMDFWSLGQVDPAIMETLTSCSRIWLNHIFEIITKYEPQLEVDRATLVAHIMVSMMYGASIQYLNGSAPFDLDAYFETCLSMIEFYLDAQTPGE